MKKLVLWLSLVFLVLIVILGLGLWLVLSPLKISGAKPILFRVEEKESAPQIIEALRHQGLTRKTIGLKFYTFLAYRNKTFPPGVYELDSKMSAKTLLDHLFSGKRAVFRVTFPEGFRFAQMGLRLEKESHGYIKAWDFIEKAKDKEGYLFPDTYEFFYEATPESIISKMEERFKEETKTLNIKKEDIILASLVERETKSEEERPKIAAVFLNRLNKGMKLEADPTVRFAIDTSLLEKKPFDSPQGRPDLYQFDFWAALKHEDLSFSSPYNTYQNEGLPPAPIANPGLKSLEAVKNPAKDFDYFYFFHPNGGEAVFSKTFEEHQAKLKAASGT